MNSTLKALSSAVLALPGVTAADEASPVEYSLGYRFHSYSEDQLTSDKQVGETTDRYDIRVNQFHLDMTWPDKAKFALAVQREVMSGASPWYTVKSEDGTVKQVMSGATIRDTRTDVVLRGDYLTEQQNFGVMLNFSEEDDYQSLGLGAEYSVDFNDKHNTFTFAADFANDDIAPTDSDIFTDRPVEESKHSVSFFASLSQILSKNAIVQFGLSYSIKSGYLSDPYKLANVNSNVVNDSRPERRTLKAASIKYRHFFSTYQGALHLDYRYFWDTWDIEAHTLDVNFHQPLPAKFKLVLGARFYNQSASYFYEHYYDNARADSYYSTDYRLSEYGAVTYLLELSKAIDAVRLYLNWQNYQSGGNKAWANAVDENPALLDFTLLSAGFEYRF